ncbi:MAG: hypothetical protein QOJ98_730 [Acidobacteriota bacterium]|nr:hypothetical protein [Acidobacteriota bacterium]
MPLSLRILNFFNAATQLGWIVFGFGTIFFYFFGTNADLSFATFRDAGGRAAGRVLRIEQTGASENGATVEAEHYEYSVAGRPFSSKSYSTAGSPAEGEAVTVEYDEDHPGRSRIAGMRRAIFGPWAMVVVVFPLVGFVILMFATRSGMKRNHLLRDGVLTTGKLVGTVGTNVYVNKRRVWKLTFEFTDRMGQRREAVVRTTDTEGLRDEAAEPLLYDPDDPQRAYLLDEAPARPRFEENGEMAGRPVAALFALLIPALVMGLNALLLGMKYLR